MAAESSALDQIDLRILRELERGARISWRELGEAVHLSPTSAADRVRRLERDGVIEGYTVRVDPDALGRTVQAVVDVKLGPGDVEEFEARLAQRDEVTFAAYVTGTADYSINVACHGADGLDTFVRWLRSEAGVASTETKLLLRVVRP
ncbi:AsnC family transcriptional regulator [Ilumatobacter fluminis]|uniref:AsnC family transcriptional regulator n=1 Tax=Ilumatobacter fluminis TaxID=467091 RepID=A0A4R7HZT7_9ACTN|nr:Lrp/AsnC family transcriptional regulator [Ilumatobacter fluminis]TDT16777.1 AsnC family transcriptional regulator [Ilumatobacter fluminis]